jgi:hypothetical protein
MGLHLLVKINTGPSTVQADHFSQSALSICAEHVLGEYSFETIVWVLNTVCKSRGRIQIECVLEQGAEKDFWT